jgi:hypothetical protein
MYTIRKTPYCTMVNGHVYFMGKIDGVSKNVYIDIGIDGVFDPAERNFLRIEKDSTQEDLDWVVSFLTAAAGADGMLVWCMQTFKEHVIDMLKSITAVQLLEDMDFPSNIDTACMSVWLDELHESVGVVRGELGPFGICLADVHRLFMKFRSSLRVMN